MGEPVSFRIDTFGTEHEALDNMYASVLRSVDFRPMAIIDKFGFRNPIIFEVSCYGHLGKNSSNIPWEQMDLKIL